MFESGDFWQFHAALLKQLCLTVNNCSNYFTCIMVSKEKIFVRAKSLRNIMSQELIPVSHPLVRARDASIVVSGHSVKDNGDLPPASIFCTIPGRP